MIDCVVIEYDDSYDAGYRIVNYSYSVTSFPIDGISDAMEVLIKRTPYEVPDYDSRLYDLVTTYSISEDYDEEYPTQKMWVTTYSLSPTSTEAKETAVEEAETTANLCHMSTTEMLKYLTIGVALADKRAQGLTISTAQETFMTELQEKAVSFWANNILSAAKKASIEAGEEVDIDEGWV
jgi:hypothetical protein